MELRHLRCFVVLAEELHFGRAAERLNIEQSPLSRTIKELEDRLGVLLFHRDRRGTVLSHAGMIFLQDVRQIFTTLEQAKTSVKTAASGSCGLLRIALSDGADQPRLATLLALSREEEPAVEIRLTEVPFSEQLRGLHNGTFDAGFSRTPATGEGICAIPLWQEPLVAAVPSRHPLLAHPVIPLDELRRYPVVVVLPHPDVHNGPQRHTEHLLRTAAICPTLVERVTSIEMMLTLVAAGHGIGFCTTQRIATCCHSNVVARPLALDDATATTYLLMKSGVDASERLQKFISRATRDTDNPSLPGDL